MKKKIKKIIKKAKITKKSKLESYIQIERMRQYVNDWC